MKRPWIYLCFFLSGFSGLVNEVVWSRLFVYTMGSSHLSIAVVVSVFMGGLALGSLLGGRLADRARSPLRFYGGLVFAAGVLSGAVAPLLWLATPLLGAVYRIHDGAPGHPLFTAAKALVCSATILLPTTLMGATLPVLARHLTWNLKELGARLGTLYGVNTLGAVAGAAAAGFFLIGSVGLAWSAALAALLDVAVGGAVLLATRREEPARPAGASPSIPPGSRAAAAAERRGPGPAGAAPLESPRLPAAVKVAIVAFGASGFANMCLQLGWTRALIVSLGNSTYAFSVIVAIFIFGLAAGGWIAGLFADRLRQPIAAFGWLLLATACAAALTLPWLGLSPARFAWEIGATVRAGQAVSFVGFLSQGAARVALLILPAATLMGMAFPLAGRLRALASGGVGQAVGAAYAANTTGAILGTALTGFVLIPLLGRIWALLYLAVGVGVLAGVAVLAAAPGRRKGLRFALLGAVLLSLLAVTYQSRPAGLLDTESSRTPYWHPVVFALGSYLNIISAIPHESAEEFARSEIRRFEPLYYRDGEAASVAVLRERASGHLMLNISGKTDASAGEFSCDLQTQLLMGHLPLLVHPGARRALNLGLGGGMSLGAMASHQSLEEIDLLELSPEVEEAARLWFSEVNNSALTNPKVRKVIGDGRNHLAHTRRSYDIISSEPSNFWIAGLGNLFTEEFYRLAQRRLNPGGLVCQWIYGYSIRLQDYRIALRTFFRVFPHVAVWSNNFADTILLGSEEEIVLDHGAIRNALGETAVRDDLAVIGVQSPEDLLRYFQCEGESLRSWVGEGPTNRDLFPILEFSSPLGFYDADAEIPLALAAAAPGPVRPGLLRGFGPESLAAVESRRSQSRLLTAFFLRLYSLDYAAAVARYRELAQGGDGWALDCASRELAQRAPALVQKQADLLELARAAHDTAELCLSDDFRPPPGRELVSALEGFRRAAAGAPSRRWEPYLALGAVEIKAGRFEEASASLEIAGRRRAPPQKVSLLQAVLLGTRGDVAGAEGLLRRALLETPPGKEDDRGECLYNLAYSIERQDRFAEAEGFYLQAVGLENKPVRGWTAVARCRRLHGDLEAALKAGMNALEAAGKSRRQCPEALVEIARSRAASGRLAEAVEWMEGAARAVPGTYDAELAQLRERAHR